MGELKPYLAMFVVQLIYAGLTLLSKAVFNRGMNTFVFIFYRQLIGALILVPLAFILEKKTVVSVSLSFSTLCKIFVSSFFGVTLTLNLQAIALVYTSATLAAAIVNSLPASTFFFAVLLRMEKVNIRTKCGVTKIASVLVCLVGVATLAFYKGPQLRIGHYYNDKSPDHEDHFSSSKRWVLGSLVLFISVIIWSLWLVIQAQILKSYPAKLKFTSLQCLSSSIQSFCIAIAFERDIEQWKLGWDMKLLAVVYCGTLVTGIIYYLQAWAIQKRGPVFPALWNPLSFLIATAGSIFLLGEPLLFGSVLGGIVLIISLYSVLWAKSKEEMSHQQNSLPIKEGAVEAQ
ncbi:WAT1-related protein At5g64700-like isoform X1 [Vigna radiata var. radiata]|uniref:WAT1-related protein n=1 Tax=Vigna radiata var. radiata TaxID=3916 RepID=A0A1S3VYE5_VIGRR|nr:WAT1-related protein At5g64700-like isoform X1 [Vigna radiata var. radiata]